MSRIFLALVLAGGMVAGSAGTLPGQEAGLQPPPSAPDTILARVVVYLPFFLDHADEAQRLVAFAHQQLALGRHVIVFLDHDGVNLARRDPPAGSAEATSKISAELDRIMDQGGEVLVCPICARDAGLDERLLRAHVHFARCGDLSWRCLRAFQGAQA